MGGTLLLVTWGSSRQRTFLWADSRPQAPAGSQSGPHTPGGETGRSPTRGGHGACALTQLPSGSPFPLTGGPEGGVPAGPLGLGLTACGPAASPS